MGVIGVRGVVEEKPATNYRGFMKEEVAKQNWRCLTRTTKLPAFRKIIYAYLYI